MGLSGELECAEYSEPYCRIFSLILHILIVASRASQAGHVSLSKVISNTKDCLPILAHTIIARTCHSKRKRDAEIVSNKATKHTYQTVSPTLVSDDNDTILTTNHALDMATIIGGCAVQNSAPIHLDHTLFGADYVQVTDGTSSKSTSGSPAMSLGTRIGIAIGGICFLLALIGITIVCCGRRRRRAKIAERQRRAEEYTGFGSVNRVLPAPRVTTKWESDMSGVMEESPMSANAYLNDKHGFSPYSSQYNSPISARDVVAPQQWEWPQQPGFEMDRVRTAGTPVDKEQEDQRLHQEWAMEAATRGFTVSPMMPPPPPPPRAKQ